MKFTMDISLKQLDEDKVVRLFQKWIKDDNIGAINISEDWREPTLTTKVSSKQ